MNKVNLTYSEMQEMAMEILNSSYKLWNEKVSDPSASDETVSFARLVYELSTKLTQNIDSVIFSMNRPRQVKNVHINDPEKGIFLHKCEYFGCENHILYDDEPFCYIHSPDEGSSVIGYSAYRNHLNSKNKIS